MRTQRSYATCLGMSKRKRKRKDSPLSKKKEKERDDAYKRSSYTIHQKNIHTLAHLDQDLWLVSPLDPVFDLAKYEKQVCFYTSIPTAPPKRSLRSRMEKKGRLSKPWWGWKHHWAIWDYHFRRSSSYVFIYKQKIIKTPSMLHSWVVMPWCLSRSISQPLKATK